VLSPVTKIPPELEKSVSAIVDWDLPNRQEIEQIARNLLAQRAARRPSSSPRAIATYIERVVEAALGLTAVEAENVFAKAMVRTHTFDLETILEEKKQIIRKSGLLEYYEHREEFGDVGGMDTLKDWLVKRRSAFSSRARDFGLPLPKGILLIGVPGTGKSLTAKAVGALWQMPLLAPRRRQDLRRPGR
jgi:SpoVK/Ycf46/Vps4 family AAA+-type ATPase